VLHRISEAAASAKQCFVCRLNVPGIEQCHDEPRAQLERLPSAPQVYGFRSAHEPGAGRRRGVQEVAAQEGQVRGRGASQPIMQCTVFKYLRDMNKTTNCSLLQL